MDQFPPNSKKAETRAAEPKKIERVTSVNAVRRRKPLGTRFSHVFFGGDARGALEYTFTHVLIPQAQEMFLDAWTSVMEKRIYGDSRPKRYRGAAPTSGPGGYVAYNVKPQRGDDRPPMGKMLSRGSRARHDFGDIIINSRQEAEEVIDRLYDLVDKYDNASVADLYELTGLESTHTDFKWGWTDLRGARVGRTRQGGYILELPEPEYFQ